METTTTTLVSPDIFLGLYSNGEIDQNASYTIIIKDLESLNLATNNDNGILSVHCSGVIFNKDMKKSCEQNLEFELRHISKVQGCDLFSTMHWNFVPDWIEYVRIPDSAWCAGRKDVSKTAEHSSITRTPRTVASNINSIAKSLVSTKYHKQPKSTEEITQVYNSPANVLHSAIISALYTALDTLLDYYGENSENYLSFRKTYYGRFLDFVYYMQIHYDLEPEDRWSEINSQWYILCSSIQNEYNTGDVECMGLEV